VFFKPAGKITCAKAPVLLHFLKQQHILICEGMESSETHHGQDTVYIIFQYYPLPTVL